MADVTWYDRLSGDDVEAVRALLLAAQARDGRPEVAAAGPLPRELRSGRHLLLVGSDGRLLGYAHLDVTGDARGRPVGEVFVQPDGRRHGVGAALTERLVEASAGRPLRIWSHGDHPGAARIAEKFGFVRVRELLKMGLDFEAADVPAIPLPSWPPGVRLRTFVAGQDEPDVVRVNQRAFGWHPEQGMLTVEDLIATQAEDWFDPDGFFLAVDAEDRLLGFHWTKVHRQDPPVGEVYVVGVDPEAQGGGLGTALTLAGLHHLHRVGLSRVILYVESDNVPAMAVYAHLGFTTIETDVQYELSRTSPS